MNKEIEFNTGVDTSPNYQKGMAGWFSGFCPSNGIADSKYKQTNSVHAEKLEWDKKYASLQNGNQAAEWADLKNEVARLEKLIQEEKTVLSQENSIADALGLGSLSAWCNGAVSRRKRAEAALSQAQKELGIIKGSYQTLEKQQKEGIAKASEVIVANTKTLEGIKQQIKVVRQKIAEYKAQRDAEKIAKQAQVAAEANNPKKINTAGFLSKENAPLVVGGLVLVGTVLYFNNKKKERKSNLKKVKA